MKLKSKIQQLSRLFYLCLCIILMSSVCTVSAAKQTVTQKQRQRYTQDVKKLRLSKTSITLKKVGDTYKLRVLPASLKSRWQLGKVTTSNKQNVTLYGKNVKAMTIMVKAKKANAKAKIKAKVISKVLNKTVTLTATAKVAKAPTVATNPPDTPQTPDDSNNSSNQPPEIQNPSSDSQDQDQSNSTIIPPSSNGNQNSSNHTPYYPSYQPDNNNSNSSNNQNKPPSNENSGNSNDSNHPSTEPDNHPPISPEPTTPAAIKLDYENWQFDSLSLTYNGKSQSPTLNNLPDFVTTQTVIKTLEGEILPDGAVDVGQYLCEINTTVPAEYEPVPPLTTEFTITPAKLDGIDYNFDPDTDILSVQTGVIASDYASFVTTVNDEASADPSRIDFSQQPVNQYTVHTEFELLEEKRKNYLIDDATEEFTKTAIFDLKSQTSWFVIAVTPYQPDANTLRFNLTLEDACLPCEGSTISLAARVTYDATRISPKGGFMPSLIGNNGWSGYYLPSNQRAMNISTKYSYDDYGPLKPGEKYGLGSIDYTINAQDDGTNLVWRLDHIRVYNNFYEQYPFDFYSNPVTVIVNRTTPSEADIYPAETLTSNRDLISNTVYTDRISGTIAPETGIENLTTYLNSLQN